VKRQTNDPKLLAAVRKTFVENISLDLSQTKCNLDSSLLHYFSNEMPSKSLSYKGTDTGCWASPAGNTAAWRASSENLLLRPTFFII